MNKPATAFLALAIAAAGIATSLSAFAHGPRVHGGVRFGLYVGAPLVAWRGYYGPWPYYPPYYSAPMVVTVPASPQTYVEQAPAPAQAAPAAPQPGYWYYCADARAYYPYVKECPSGWQRVPPQPGSG